MSLERFSYLMVYFLEELSVGHNIAVDRADFDLSQAYLMVSSVHAQFKILINHGNGMSVVDPSGDIFKRCPW